MQSFSPRSNVQATQNTEAKLLAKNIAALKQAEKEHYMCLFEGLLGLVIYFASVVWMVLFIGLGREFASITDFTFLTIGIAPSVYLLIMQRGGIDQNFPDAGG
tara:strand:- start:354 stop:662 length:309 start_codon:yes stop_codon:yes gene_type:complete